MAAKAAANLEKVKGVINTVLDGLDEHIADYIISVLEDDPLQRVSWVSGAAEEEEGGEAEGGEVEAEAKGVNHALGATSGCPRTSVVQCAPLSNQDGGGRRTRQATHHLSRALIPSPTYTTPPHASHSHRTWRHR